MRAATVGLVEVALGRAELALEQRVIGDLRERVEPEQLRSLPDVEVDLDPRGLGRWDAVATEDLRGEHLVHVRRIGVIGREREVLEPPEPLVVDLRSLVLPLVELEAERLLRSEGAGEAVVALVANADVLPTFALEEDVGVEVVGLALPEGRGGFLRDAVDERRIEAVHFADERPRRCLARSARDALLAGVSCRRVLARVRPARPGTRREARLHQAVAVAESGVPRRLARFAEVEPFAGVDPFLRRQPRERDADEGPRVETHAWLEPAAEVHLARVPSDLSLAGRFFGRDAPASTEAAFSTEAARAEAALTEATRAESAGAEASLAEPAAHQVLEVRVHRGVLLGRHHDRELEHAVGREHLRDVPRRVLAVRVRAPAFGPGHAELCVLLQAERLYVGGGAAGTRAAGAARCARAARTARTSRAARWVSAVPTRRSQRQHDPHTHSNAHGGGISGPARFDHAGWKRAFRPSRRRASARRRLRRWLPRTPRPRSVRPLRG